MMHNIKRNICGMISVVGYILVSGILLPLNVHAMEKGATNASESRSSAKSGAMADVNKTDPAQARRLVLSARYGQYDVVVYLLDRGVPVDSRDEFGSTALIAASETGRLRIAQLLLSRGADVKVQNLQHDSALMVAARNNDPRIVALLLDKGTEVNINRPDGQTALFDAVESGNAEIVNSLLQHGANPNVTRSGKRSDEYDGYTPLMLAARHGERRVEGQWAAIAKDLIRNGAAINAMRADGGTALEIAESGGDGEIAQLLRRSGALETEPVYAALSPIEALVKAATLGDLAKMKDLVDEHVDVNAPDSLGMTPLVAAASRGHTDVIAFLLKQHAKVDEAAHGRPRDPLVLGLPEDEQDLARVGAGNDSALIAATRRGDEKIVALLLDHGASMTMRNRRDESAPQLAVDLGYGAIVKLFLKHGLDPDHRVGSILPEPISNRPQETAGTPLLVRAVQRGHENVVRIALENGANPNIRDRDGMTALYWGADLGHKAIVSLLLKHGADPNVKTIVGETALMAAARNGAVDIVNSLVDAGADVNAREIPEVPYGYNRNLGTGRTALIYAAQNNQDAVVRLLVKSGAYKQLTAYNGVSALAIAERNGNKKVVQVLEERNGQ